MKLAISKRWASIFRSRLKTRTGSYLRAHAPFAHEAPEPRLSDDDFFVGEAIDLLGRHGPVLITYAGTQSVRSMLLSLASDRQELRAELQLTKTLFDAGQAWAGVLQDWLNSPTTGILIQLEDAQPERFITVAWVKEYVSKIRQQRVTV